MGFFDDMFDTRRNDFGQMVALRKHDEAIEMLDKDFEDLASASEQRDAALEDRISKLRDGVGHLRKRLNRVELVCEALFVCLEKQGQIDRETLRASMAEIDARDGVVDGRAKQPAT